MHIWAIDNFRLVPKSGRLLNRPVSIPSIVINPILLLGNAQSSEVPSKYTQKEKGRWLFIGVIYVNSYQLGYIRGTIRAYLFLGQMTVRNFRYGLIVSDILWAHRKRRIHKGMKCLMPELQSQIGLGKNSVRLFYLTILLGVTSLNFFFSL